MNPPPDAKAESRWYVRNGEILRVGHDNEGYILGLVHGVQQVHDASRCIVIQGSRGLVGQKKFRLVD